MTQIHIFHVCRKFICKNLQRGKKVFPLPMSTLCPSAWPDTTIFPRLQRLCAATENECNMEDPAIHFIHLFTITF